MFSGLALVLLELSKESSPESSTSSLSLETVVNLVPEAKLSDRLLVLQLGSLRSAIFSYRVTWNLHMRNMHGAKKITELCQHYARNYSSIKIAPLLQVVLHEVWYLNWYYDMLCTWWLPGLDVKKPWLAPSGPIPVWLHE